MYHATQKRNGIDLGELNQIKSRYPAGMPIERSQKRVFLTPQTKKANK
jgi:hypothetical protein